MRGKSPARARRGPMSLYTRAQSARQMRAGLQTGSRPPKTANPINEDLAVELYSMVRLALKNFGVTAAQQRRAIKRSSHLAAAPRVSGPLLRDMRGLCGLLLEWSREAEFLDADGKPRVLFIEGSGATFECLAQRFLPKLPLARVVAMACATAEVTTRPGGKIALLGGVLVNLARSTENLLAHAIRQIDQLLKTILHNAIVRQKGIGTARLERMVLGVISRSAFNDLMKELRPQIDDLLQRVDSAVQPRQPKTPRSLRAATVVSVGVYVSQEDDWERAGIDVRPTIKDAAKQIKSRR
jgi:hypothetical protein